MVSLVVIAFVIAVTTIQPVLLICTAHRPFWPCASILAWPIDLFSELGKWYASEFVCSPANESCTINLPQLGATQSAFQAVFGFAIAINLIGKLWKKCRDTLACIAPDIADALATDPAEVPNADAHKARLRARSDRWVRWVHKWARSSAVLAHFTFLLTAFVAGNLLLLTIYSSHELIFSKPMTIAFAIAPFLVAALLYLKVWLVSYTGPVLAPALYWEKYQSQRLTDKSRKQLELYRDPPFQWVTDTSDSIDQSLKSAYLRIVTTIRRFRGGR